MKILLAGLIVALLSVVTKADEVSTGGTTIEQRVVELHITKKARIDAENSRFKKKIQNLADHAVCSGSFINQNGFILTAGHCAQDAETIVVVTSENQEYEATIIATSSAHDLALLHIDKLNTPHFDLAKQALRGEKVFILGSPLAISNSLSTGIVAKLAGDFTLVDCSALPGNSGSAVYNEAGEMICVLTAGYIVGMGTTHLNVAQNIDAIWFFLYRAFRGIPQ